jgi:cytochrome c-type biogenesis protein CcmH/NrfF
VSFNPLRNEADAFRVLLWFIAVMAVIVGIVLLVRAVS